MIKIIEMFERYNIICGIGLTIFIFEIKNNIQVSDILYMNDNIIYYMIFRIFILGILCYYFYNKVINYYINKINKLELELKLNYENQNLLES